MVVQKNWTNADSQQQPIAECSTSWPFPQPEKVPQSRSNCTANLQSVAINTLAAMHRRFSLPGPVQPHSRPISEFRASANKSLDMLRQTVQSAVTREIDQVIKKYLEKFFVPAVNNIRLNLGEESVSEDQVRAVCRAMLDATRVLYAAPPRLPPPAPVPAQPPSEVTTLVITADTQSHKPNISPCVKRKESEILSNITCTTKRKKIKQEPGVEGNIKSPLKKKDPEKWNPDRFNQDTLFIMGSHAHKVLGLGNSRGRLYTKHSGLLRYPADSTDKEWIAGHNLVNAVGGKTYIMVLEDIEELATSDLYKHTSLPMLGELSGFKVPPFMLKKIKAFVSKKDKEDENESVDNQQVPVLDTNRVFKIENDINDIFNKGNKYHDVKDDFPEIKVDGIKVEDIDDIKVEQMDDIDNMIDPSKIKVEVDANEHIDFNLDNIKVEDIKLEPNDSLFACKDINGVDSDLNGLFDSDIEFLSKNLGNIESDTEARKTIEKLTGANVDTITLMGDEFDFGTALNTNNFPEKPTTKCITVASTTSGVVHAVPVTHLTAPTTLHYYRHCTPTSSSHLITGIPINTKTNNFTTVMSQGGTSIIGFGARTTTAVIGSSAQYVNVTSKTFPTGNILHNAIVSRNFINRSNFSVPSYNVTNVRPIIQSTAPKISTVVTSCNSNDLDMSTTKDMIDNACNSSLMLKKVLTLGSGGCAKSFMMHNTQRVLSTGFATGSTPPPNVTIVSSCGGNSNIPSLVNVLPPTPSTLSSTHATLSALLASSENLTPTTK